MYICSVSNLNQNEMTNKIIKLLFYTQLLIVFISVIILKESILINLLAMCMLLDRILREKK